MKSLYLYLYKRQDYTVVYFNQNIYSMRFSSMIEFAKELRDFENSQYYMRTDEYKLTQKYFYIRIFIAKPILDKKIKDLKLKYLL